MVDYTVMMFSVRIQQVIAVGVIGGAIGTAKAQQPGLTPTLKPIDQTIADINPLSVSLRDMHVDLRMPIGFQNVYAVPGQSTMLMRSSGALHAVFPHSAYAPSRNGVRALIPAGTVFYIGLPPEHVPDEQVEDESPNLMSTRIYRQRALHVQSIVKSKVDSLVPPMHPDDALDQMPTTVSTAPRITRESPDVSSQVGPTVANHEAYRSQRLAELIQRAANAGAASPSTS